MQGSESEVHQCAIRPEYLLCGSLHCRSCAEDYCHGTLEIYQGQLVSMILLCTATESLGLSTQLLGVLSKGM